MATRILVSGHWQQDAGQTRVHMWCIGQQVNVQPRTWPGMNRPGGHGRIVKLHYAEDGQIVSMDVKYTVSTGTDKNLAPYLVEPWQDLERTGRGRARTAATSSPNDHPAKTAEAVPDAGGPEKENALQSPVPPPPRRRHNHHHQSERRRPTLKPLASFKKSKKVASRPVASPSSASASLGKTLKVPQWIYADDDSQSVVSELNVGAGVDEPQRYDYLQALSPWSSPSDASKKRPAAAERARLHSLDTATSACHDHDESQVSRRSSPCSKARSIVSGQLSVVANPGAPSNAPFLNVDSRTSSTSPSATKCLAVGQVAKSPTGAMGHSSLREGASSSSSPRTKLLPPAGAKLYVSELRPVPEMPRGDRQGSSQAAMDHRDDEEDGHRARDDHEHQPLDDAMSFSSDCARRNQFVLHLVDLLQENDGVVDEDEVLILVNRKVDPSFDASKLNEYLQYLCDDNKIMRSDGQVYSI